MTLSIPAERAARAPRRDRAKTFVTLLE